MGLDASVRCTCYEEGRLTTPIPYSDLFYIDEDDYPRLRVPYEGNEDKYEVFEEWLWRRCCPHEDMDYAVKHISNWSGVGSFRDALHRAGAEHFPALVAELPHANGGTMPAEAARRVLGELAYFAEQADLGETVCLINGLNSKIIRRGEGRLITAVDPRVDDSGFDERGFYIVRKRPEPHEVFRAVRVEQRVIGEHMVEYVDRDSGGRVTTNAFPIWIRSHESDPTSHAEYLRYIHIERRRQDVSDFSYILGQLRTICEASVATGHPVRWA